MSFFLLFGTLFVPLRTVEAGFFSSVFGDSAYIKNADPVTENSVPAGAVEGTTSFGKPGYGGPCPPSGTHRYFFKLCALNKKLELSPSAEKVELEEVMAGQVLDQAELIGLYSRQ